MRDGKIDTEREKERVTREDGRIDMDILIDIYTEREVVRQLVEGYIYIYIEREREREREKRKGSSESEVEREDGLIDID